MNPVEQRHWRQEEVDVKGDCLKCAIASVLELPYRTVPHFVQRHGKNWTTHLRPWLRKRGFDFLFYVLDDIKKSDWLPSGYWIASVTRPEGTRHAIVMRGSEPVYDPNPDPARKGKYSFDRCGCLVIFPFDPALTARP